MPFVVRNITAEIQSSAKPFEKVEKQESFSTNLNTRDVRVQRESATWFSGNFTNPKIAILELSTKAVKLLLCNDQETLKEEGFNFNLFDRQSDRTETGKGLDRNNRMDMQYFNRTVLQSITKFVRYAKDKGVDVLYSIATAAYRTATNRDEILRSIQSVAKINVNILSKQDEADATLWAYVYSTKHKEVFLKSPNIILIDQGGGSTEISFFENQKLIESKSLGVGVTALRNILYSHSGLLLQEAFNQVDTYSAEQMKQYLNSVKIDTRSKEIHYIGVGKSIQWVAGKNNREQHDKVISLEKICKTLNDIDNEFVSRFTVNQIQRNTDTNGTFPSDLDMRLGLPLIIELMKHCGIQNVHISGTGLWYGIFFKEFYNIK